MSRKSNSGVNAGVHANVGMDFQKHCTIYLLLENYSTLVNEKYFIILEHHDDIVFGFMNSNGEVRNIKTYQAKKSSNEWKRSTILEIVYKIISKTKLIKNDPIIKSKNFSIDQYFATNNSIYLKVVINKVEYNCRVNETNSLVKYSTIDAQIRKHFKEKLADKHSATQQELAELDNLYLLFIDLSRNSQNQRELLLGKIHTVFQDKIADYKAALDTLIYFLKMSEEKYNQGNVALLSDKDKRIESDSIKEIFGLLTTKSKAFNLWRSKESGISASLNLKVFDKKTFEFNFQSSFDKFKDLENVEHRKILTFVKSKEPELRNITAEEKCLEYLLTSLNQELSTTLNGINLKAAVFAAFVELMG